MLLVGLLKVQPNMSGQEVLTIQLGNYANHVGSHFWNIQVPFKLLESPLLWEWPPWPD